LKNNKQRINKLLKTGFLLFFLLMFGSQAIMSQGISFNEVHPTEGKEFDFITGIAQDENGLMWFSTKIGLYRYDGQTISSFENNPGNPNSLANNFIESIFADNNGKIWIGTLGHGLDLFDTETEIFTHFRHDPDNPYSISNDTITKILRDDQGKLWIGTHGGLEQFNYETNSFTHYRHDANDPKSLSNNQVRAIYEDSKGILWVGTGSPYEDNGGGPDVGGLNRMDMNSGTFTRYLHDPKNINSLINNKISAIYEDDQGYLLIGTKNNGLHRLNQKVGSFDRLIFDPAYPEKLSGPPIMTGTQPYEHITFITQDSRGSYWYGTTESGIYYMDPTLGKIVRFHGSNEPATGFSDVGAWSILTSRDGILWIGGIAGHIYRLNPKQKKIPFYKTSVAVNNIYEELNGDLWIATDNKIIKKTSKNGSVKQYTIDITQDDDEDDYINIIKEDLRGNIWIGGRGLSLYEKDGQKFNYFKHDPENSKSISHNSVLALYEDSKANFWVGTVHGINLMDREKGTFMRYYLNEADTGYVGGNIVTSILEDNNGNLWAGIWNAGGIYKFDTDMKDRKKYLKGSSIVSIYQDIDEVIWVGTNYGLFKYDDEADIFQRYFDPTTKNGFFFVSGLVEDDQQYLWLSTNKKIVRINPQRTESNTLGETYGIDNVEFSWKSGSKGRNGKIYFATNKGYYAVDPGETINDSLLPEIAFTGFRVADQLVVPGESGSLGKDIVYEEEIRLQFDQNIFSFDYAVIDYVNPQENKLIYILENFDKHWLQSNSEGRAYYFNVPPGKYTFRVKGANSYGLWSEKKMNIVILPPWWKTWWAYGLYTVLFLLLIFSYDRVQRRRLLEKAKKQAREKELEQAKEIQKAYTELKATQVQLIHSEKMASLGELTAGIAHEIQNPLNFIINFSEVNSELIDEIIEEIEEGNINEVKEITQDIAGNEKKIMHHGKRADAIVKNMLQHSRRSNDEKMLTDINALADEYLRLSYHGLRAKDKSFNAEFKTDLDENLPKVKAIPQDIGRVLLNLINNAFHAVFTKALLKSDGYKALVVVSTKKLEDKVEIRVKDNGGGISEEIRDKIFQPFFTTKSTADGTGLGLSLSYDIITKGHGGKIKVITKEGEGTEFIVELPVH